MRDHPIFDALRADYYAFHAARLANDKPHAFQPGTFPFANGVGPGSYRSTYATGGYIAADPGRNLGTVDSGYVIPRSALKNYFTDTNGHLDVYLDTRRSSLESERHQHDRGADKYIE